MHVARQLFYCFFMNGKAGLYPIKGGGKMKHWKILVVTAVVGLLMSGTWMARAQDIVIGFSGPLSGPAAEYGQDMLYGIDMAVNEINAGGGVTIGGKKHLIKLEKLDDRADPTAAVNNARRLRNSGAIAVYNGVFTTIAAMNKINQEKNNEFLLMAYTSTPKLYEMGNKLLIGTTAPPFTVYLDQFIASAMKRGYKKVAMVVTAGAYGEEWRDAFRERWTKLGGIITADKPANYYTETDFSAPLAAALATKPEAMLIGGPSATTALVIEQARGMGFKGAFIVIDQAKLDYMAYLLKGYKLMNNTIGVATPMSVPFPRRSLTKSGTKPRINGWSHRKASGITVRRWLWPEPSKKRARQRTSIKSERISIRRCRSTAIPYRRKYSALPKRAVF